MELYVRIREDRHAATPDEHAWLRRRSELLTGRPVDRVLLDAQRLRTDSCPPREQKQLETDPSYFGEIYIMRADADGSGVRRLTNVPGYDGGPFFSPDGKRIIWRRFDERGVIADVWTMNLDGTDQRQITDFGAMSWAPYIHPSGRYILFASNKLGFENFEVFMVDIDGTKEPVRVTYSDGFDGLPVPSPDGHAAGVDVEPRRWPRGTDLSRPVEPSACARCARGRTAETEGDQRIRTMKKAPIFVAALLSPSPRFPRRRRRQQPRQAHARMSRRSRPTDSRAARRDRRENGWPATTSRRSWRASAPGRCPDAATCSCRSTSLPAAATAARSCRRGRQRFSAPADVVALSFSDDGDVIGASGLRRLRHRRARKRRTSATTATRRSTSRTRSSSSCAISRRMRTRRRRRSSRATRIFATRRWPRGSAARKRCSS